MNRIKYIFTIATFVFCYTSASAQSSIAKTMMSIKYNPVIYSEIEANVLTPSSPYYYPELFKRYEKNDTTLTITDYRNLYYGYMFQQEYRPHTESAYVDSLSNLINRDGGVFREASSNKAQEFIVHILDDRPFSLKFLNMMSYIADMKEDNEASKAYALKFNMLVSSIFSSGTGKSEEKPWRVLYRSDAQSVMLFLGAEVTRRVYITAPCEYYHIRERQGDAKGYYFDFDAIYTRPTEPKGKRKMEFNPLSNPKSDKFINNKIIK